MKAAKYVLWTQLGLGLCGSFAAYSYVHWGAMSAAWAHALQKDFEKMQLGSGFQMPAPIMDQSIQRILGDMEAYGRARADAAFYWMRLFARLSCSGSFGNRPTNRMQATAAPLDGSSL